MPPAATPNHPPTPAIAVAEAVRSACLQAAINACEDARIAGLCWEGAWEVAIEAMRSVDLSQVVRECVLVKDA